MMKLSPKIYTFSKSDIDILEKYRYKIETNSDLGLEGFINKYFRNFNLIKLAGHSRKAICKYYGL